MRSEACEVLVSLFLCLFLSPPLPISPLSIPYLSRISTQPYRHHRFALSPNHHRIRTFHLNSPSPIVSACLSRFIVASHPLPAICYRRRRRQTPGFVLARLHRCLSQLLPRSPCGEWGIASWRVGLQPAIVLTEEEHLCCDRCFC